MISAGIWGRSNRRAVRASGAQPFPGELRSRLPCRSWRSFYVAARCMGAAFQGPVLPGGAMSLLGGLVALTHGTAVERCWRRVRLLVMIRHPAPGTKCREDLTVISAAILHHLCWKTNWCCRGAAGGIWMATHRWRICGSRLGVQGRRARAAAPLFERGAVQKPGMAHQRSHGELSAQAYSRQGCRISDIAVSPMA